jgi:hypothetical protein
MHALQIILAIVFVPVIYGVLYGMFYLVIGAMTVIERIIAGER